MITLVELLDRELAEARRVCVKRLEDPTADRTYDQAWATATILVGNAYEELTSGQQMRGGMVRAAVIGLLLLAVQADLLMEQQGTKEPVHPDTLPKVEV